MLSGDSNIVVSFKAHELHNTLAIKDEIFLFRYLHPFDYTELHSRGMLTVKDTEFDTEFKVPAIKYIGSFLAYNFHNPRHHKGLALHPSFSPLLSALYLLRRQPVDKINLKVLKC